MIKRIIDISEQAYLHVANHQLCVDKQGQTVARISIEDLGILILEHPAIVITQSAISRCQQNNVAILFCNERHLPVSVMLPLWEGHSLHTKVLREQLSATDPTRKRLWRQVVKLKIAEQAACLEKVGKPSKVLLRLRDKVKSGDPENCEAQAARQYWPMLMGKGFKRNPDEDGTNSLLNYGYALIRAMVARALVGTGLHPSLGLHHKNQYNSLCLADDIMEPFRPWVDWQVYKLREEKTALKIDRIAKEALLKMLSDEVIFESRKMPLMIATHLLAAQLKRALSDRSQKLSYPQYFSR